MSTLVAITGGSGSGKSTLAEGLAAALPASAATLLSEDWYYRDCAAFPDFDPARFDFDDIVIRDHDLLTGGQSGAGDLHQPVGVVEESERHCGRRVEPAPVLIVEGAHLLCSAPLAELFDLRVYLDTPDDIRFIRRLLRDQAMRGRTARSVIDQYILTVRPAHFRLTHLSQERADLIVRDPSTTVDHPDPAAVAALVRPLLKHPALAAFG